MTLVEARRVAGQAALIWPSQNEFTRKHLWEQCNPIVQRALRVIYPALCPPADDEPEQPSNDGRVLIDRQCALAVAKTFGIEGHFLLAAAVMGEIPGCEPECKLFDKDAVVGWVNEVVAMRG
jgi:hypothetical protein